jgi:hypothetical protein
MYRLQRSVAVIASLLLGVAVHAENTSRTNQIRLKCKRTTVHVRIFDTSGKLVDEFEASPGPDGTISSDDPQSIEASKRFVVTSASKGCVKGQPGYDPDNAPINVFAMPCNSDPPMDLVVTSDPPATFTVMRAIPAVCRSQSQLSHGSSIVYFTSDETLTITARSIADPLMTGRLVLDWNLAPRVRQTLPNTGYGAQGGSGAAENAAVARRLKTFTIEPKVSP